ncbi:cell division protein ZapA [Sediminibacterium sp.]|jgi:cell division protein ZapA (FtsZ GTPase activity inhibitor)|uniref:cell division protein ZapA n=1 Tax=Sediminibacterium sp. TaxID=1917865 RepID=UPI000CC54914|nr:cell division protein ZapA [Chitinophaga sp.]PJE46244.1 MAG: cell division protein ZapA [Sediminibacterium sp.] [Sediminibacterium sp. FEMGT703S]
MSELIPVNIVVADRTYRLKIEPEDEEMVRKTANTINEKITEFKSNFAGKDTQDYLAMVLLWFATEQKDNAKLALLADETSKQIKEMAQTIDKALEDQP